MATENLPVMERAMARASMSCGNVKGGKFMESFEWCPLELLSTPSGYSFIFV